MSLDGKLIFGAGGWQWCVRSDVPYLSYLVDELERTVYLSWETWKTLDLVEEAIEKFLDESQEAGTGMKRIVRSAGPYGAAAKKAQEQGIAPDVDRLDDITERASALLIQAGGLRDNPTPGQLRMFLEQRDELRKDFGELEDLMRRVRSIIDLAEVAIKDLVE